jgi:glutaredoxin 3
MTALAGLQRPRSERFGVWNREIMADVVIYTRPFCGYCARALALLNRKGAAYTEIEAGFDPALRQQMIERSGRNTFPQIFIGGRHIGGCDDMMALEDAGKLDGLLAGA